MSQILVRTVQTTPQATIKPTVGAAAGGGVRGRRPRRPPRTCRHGLARAAVVGPCEGGRLVLPDGGHGVSSAAAHPAGDANSVTPQGGGRADGTMCTRAVRSPYNELMNTTIMNCGPNSATSCLPPGGWRGLVCIQAVTHSAYT